MTQSTPTTTDLPEPAEGCVDAVERDGFAKANRRYVLALSLHSMVSVCLTGSMRLLTAHRILIATAAVFFCFFGLWELRNYFTTGDGWAIFRAVLYELVAAGFGVYFKNLDRLYKP